MEGSGKGLRTRTLESTGRPGFSLPACGAGSDNGPGNSTGRIEVIRKNDHDNLGKAVGNEMRRYER